MVRRGTRNSIKGEKRRGLATECKGEVGALGTVHLDTPLPALFIPKNPKFVGNREKSGLFSINRKGLIGWRRGFLVIMGLLSSKRSPFMILIYNRRVGLTD